jgi:uncharacterized protein YbjT (DUF2867 family)
MAEQSKIAVAGATGRLGRPLVEVLEKRGHDVVPMSRATGIDVVTGDGLADALNGVASVIDVASWHAPEEGPATEFFLAATRNLNEIGAAAGVKQLVIASIIGVDRFTSGYQAAKLAHERAVLSGPLPARILRAAQFHEFVPVMLEWGTSDGTIQVPRMRTQLVAARTVAEALADLTEAESAPSDGIPEVAGPRAETLADVARLVVERRGESLEVVEGTNPDDPDAELYEDGTLLPGPDAKLAGPTFEEWLAEQA